VDQSHIQPSEILPGDFRASFSDELLELGDRRHSGLTITDILVWIGVIALAIPLGIRITAGASQTFPLLLAICCLSEILCIAAVLRWWFRWRKSIVYLGLVFAGVFLNVDQLWRPGDIDHNHLKLIVVMGVLLLVLKQASCDPKSTASARPG